MHYNYGFVFCCVRLLRAHAIHARTLVHARPRTSTSCTRSVVRSVSCWQRTREYIYYEYSYVGLRVCMYVSTCRSSGRSGPDRRGSGKPPLWLEDSPPFLPRLSCARSLLNGHSFSKSTWPCVYIWERPLTSCFFSLRRLRRIRPLLTSFRCGQQQIKPFMHFSWVSRKANLPFYLVTAMRRI